MLNATAKTKHKNEGLLSLTQPDAPFQDPGPPVTRQVCPDGPQFTSCSWHIPVKTQDQQNNNFWAVIVPL